MAANDISKFGKKVRVRVCGLLEEDGAILLLKHLQVGKKGYLWSPPGGGVEFGDDSQQSLIREFEEETGLTVEVEQFLFTNEYIDHRFHAIELFYSVKKKGGTLELGKDPELPDENQILKELRYISFDELEKMDPLTIHNAFSAGGKPVNIFQLKGLVNFINI